MDDRWQGNDNACNYCMLTAIKSEAKKDGLLVTKIPYTILEDWPSSIAVFVHPKDVTIAKEVDLDAGMFGEYFRVWLGEVNNECEC